MKNYLYYILYVAMSLILSSCGDKETPGRPIWDFHNPNIVLMVVNENNDSFLDPEYEWNILDRPIKILYNGKEYPLNEYFENGETRATSVYWFGLRAGKYYGYIGDSGSHALLFGEFLTSSDGYRGESFTVDWGDGKTKSEVKFDLYVVYNNDYTEATVHEKLWIDGELINENGLSAGAIVRPVSTHWAQTLSWQPLEIEK